SAPIPRTLTAMRILITGAGGMLGRDLVTAAERAGHEPVPHSRAELDVTDPDSVRAAIAEARPDAIVNGAAWTDVDGAEADEAAAGRRARRAARGGRPDRLPDLHRPPGAGAGAARHRRRRRGDPRRGRRALLVARVGGGDLPAVRRVGARPVPEHRGRRTPRA